MILALVFGTLSSKASELCQTTSIGFLAAGPSDRQRQQAADAMKGMGADFEQTWSGNGGFGAVRTNDGYNSLI
ncbi:hypothetical protein GGR58DRAFT_508477 [Xylaria digitata]|nr:hypothetical protein GGR58DRAFT_508477 [Xylaria digitata]